MTSDGTDDDEVDQGCCVDRCTGACGGYGFAFELAARNLRDGTGHWARLDGTCWDDCPACVPASDGTEEDLDIVLPSFVGMFRGGKADLARRAKDIARGDGSSVE